jgi:hypothetical protein
MPIFPGRDQLLPDEMPILPGRDQYLAPTSCLFENYASSAKLVSVPVTKLFLQYVYIGGWRGLRKISQVTAMNVYWLQFMSVGLVLVSHDDKILPSFDFTEAMPLRGGGSLRQLSGLWSSFDWVHSTFLWYLKVMLSRLFDDARILEMMCLFNDHGCLVLSRRTNH